MSILKLVTNPYDSELAAANLVHYVKNKAVYYGGGAVDPNHAAEQMAMVRRVFDQQNGSLMYHFMESLFLLLRDRLRMAHMN